MRILHCIPTLEIGGAERQLCYITAGLSRLGHEVDVAVMREGELSSVLRESGARVHLLGWRKAFDARLVLDLRAIVRKTGSDVVQTWLRRMDIAGGVAARITGRPWIYSERTVWKSDGWRQSLRRSLIEHSASAVVANSENAASLWRPSLRRHTRLQVIPNALPLDEIDGVAPASRASWDVALDAELLVYVGRFAAGKGTTVLAKALAEVFARRPRAVAICCGPGPLLAEFRRVVDELGIGARVRTPGYQRDVWALMKAADVVISASETEGQPNAILEAIACGTPLVLSDIPGHREHLGDGAALYFPHASESRAAVAIEAVLDDRRSAQARTALALEMVRDLSLQSIARRYAALYESLLTDRGNRGNRGRRLRAAA